MNLIVAKYPLLNAPPLQRKERSPEKQLFSTFMKDLRNNSVTDVLVKPGMKRIYYIETEGTYNYTQYYDNTPLWTILLDSETNLEIDTSTPFTLGDIFSVFFTLFFMSMLLRALISMGGVNSSIQPFSQSNKLEIEENITTRFTDVEGIDEAKNELEEIVDFLKHPDKYNKSGAKIPKGALLIGNPGTGKTLLARAIAGESSVPFIQTSGSAFIEMFVGLGARRIRDIFEKARKIQPCIVFIDEIDAIGKKRFSNGNLSNDERDQTINQLLTEMDGFSQSQVVIIGATNRADILDEALLRPGRFDRKIQVKLPDVNGREKILEVHSKNKRLAEDVSLRDIAKQTIGFSGADLENLLNECAIRAAKDNNNYTITQDIVENTYQRLVIGAKGSSRMTFETKKRVAFHEAGHAIVGVLMTDFDKLRKVSIVPRGESGGITFFQPASDDIQMYTKSYMLSQIKVALAGHAAEEIVFGKNNISTGASNDFSHVYAIAHEMVVSCGFGTTIGKINIKNKKLSQETMFKVETEIQNIVNKCYDDTMSLLITHIEKLNFLACSLIDKEVVDGDFVYSLFT